MQTFGPQLIGQTEKALNAVLKQELAEFGLLEPQWVALKLAQQWNRTDTLASFLVAESHLSYADELVAFLEHAGLVDRDGCITEAGQARISEVQAVIKQTTGSIWDSIDARDAAAAGRALSQVRAGYQAILSD